VIKFVSHKELEAMKGDILTLQDQVAHLMQARTASIANDFESFRQPPKVVITTKGSAVGSAYDDVKVETRFEVRSTISVVWNEAPVQHLGNIEHPHYLRVRVSVDFGHRGTLRYFPDENGVLMKGNK
jgi:hypothetical protein